MLSLLTEEQMQIFFYFVGKYALSKLSSDVDGIQNISHKPEATSPLLTEDYNEFLCFYFGMYICGWYLSLYSYLLPSPF